MKTNLVTFIREAVVIVVKRRHTPFAWKIPYQLFLIGLFSYVFLASCIPVEELTTGEDFTMSLSGARLGPGGFRNKELMPSADFWLASGEEVYGSWTQFNVDIQSFKGRPIRCEMCGTYKCYNQDDVDKNKIEDGLSWGDILRVLIRHRQTDNETISVIEDVSACWLEAGVPATSEGIYELGTNVNVLDENGKWVLSPIAYQTHTTLKIHLVKNDDEDSKRMPPQILKQSEFPSSGRRNPQQWQWTMGERDGKWDMNFSHKLQVARVAVLKGRDMNGEFVPSDMDNPYVTPHHIRWYTPSGQEGASDLVVTPSYARDKEQDLLTWIVKFDSTSGFPPPKLEVGDSLAIEFILEVIQ